MLTIAIGNQKGGTGKTTTTLNLGAALALHRGRRVVLVDADPQASLSISLGVDEPQASLADVLGDHNPGTHRLSQVIRQTNDAGRLWLVPSDISLASASVGLERRIGRETLLKQALAPLKADYVLIDCPPSLGLLTVNALVAADQVLIPVQTEYLALRGLAFFWRTLQQVQTLNPGLEVLGVLPTMVRGRTKHHQLILKMLQERVKVRVFAPVPQSVRVSEAHLAGRSVTELCADHAVAEAYRALALEVDRGWKH
jgi:chromosome partitioning protein